MFVSRVLSPHENVAGVLFLFLDMLECCPLHFRQKNSQLCHKIVKFWAAKSTKIIKILYFLSNAGISKKFAKFECFDKKMTNSMSFFHPKPLKLQINVRNK